MKDLKNTERTEIELRVLCAMLSNEWWCCDPDGKPHPNHEILQFAREMTDGFLLEREDMERYRANPDYKGERYPFSVRCTCGAVLNKAKGVLK